MKKTLKKFLICIMLVVIMTNFVVSNYSFADDDPNTGILEEFLGSVVGLLTLPIRIIAIAIGNAVDGLTEGVAYSQGALDENGNLITNPDSSGGSDFWNSDPITPFDIFFNRVAIIDVNFFNIKNDGTLVSTIRNSVAGWYYAMRNIAAAILLCVFIYVGIRMAISTVASDKAAYKKMLVDWICSLALIFVLQYIMIFTFAVNEAFIKALSGVDDGTAISQAMIEIRDVAFQIADLESIAATVVYCMLVAQTLALFISYFNRMLKIAFLIIISPLITLTYSIDKMGDGKAQALGTWLKEFVYTVLIQTFHCVIYMAFVGMALSIFTSGGSDDNLVGAILTMLCVKFTKDGEKILGKIFKFSDATSDTSLAVGMAASAVALQKAKGLGKGTRSALNGIKNFGGNARSFLNNAKVDLKTAGNVLFKGKSLGEAKEMATVAVLAASAAKMENAKVFKINAGDEQDKKEFEELDKSLEGKTEEEKKKAVEEHAKKNNWSNKKKEAYKYQKEVENETNANKAQGMSEELAKAQARATVARRARENSKSQKTPRVIKSAVGTYSKVKALANSSETLKQLGGMVKATAAAGAGLAAGSLVYGATGNEFNSIALGTATYKGTREFMQNSAKTLTNDTAQLFQASGDKTAADAAIHASNIRAQADVFEDGSKLKDEIDNAFKDIDQQLKDAFGENDAKKFKSTIKNVMEREIKSSPGLTNEELFNKAMANGTIQDMMKGAGPDKLAKLDMGAVKASASSVATLQRDKAIYDNMKAAGDIGLTPDAMINKSIRTFEGYVAADAANKPDTTIGKAIANGEASVNDAEIRKAVEDMSTDDIKEQERVLNAKMREMDLQMGTYAESGMYDAINEVSKERESLKAESDRLKDIRIEKEMEELGRQYKECLDKLNAQNTELTRSARKELEDLKEKLESSYLEQYDKGMKFATGTKAIPDSRVTDYREAFEKNAGARVLRK